MVCRPSLQLTILKRHPFKPPHTHTHIHTKFYQHSCVILQFDYVLSHFNTLPCLYLFINYVLYSGPPPAPWFLQFLKRYTIFIIKFVMEQTSPLSYLFTWVIVFWNSKILRSVFSLTYLLQYINTNLTVGTNQGNYSYEVYRIILPKIVTTKLSP